MSSMASQADGPLVRLSDEVDKDDCGEFAHVSARPGDSHRQLFPLPPCVPAWLSGNFSERKMVCKYVNESVKALNWLAGHKEFSNQAPDDMQLQVLQRLEGLVQRQQPNCEILNPSQALKQLLKGKSPYSVLSDMPDHDNLASYRSELVSMPPSLVGAPLLCDLLEASDRLYLEELTERMLRPAEEVAKDIPNPYWDPQLRYNQKTYHRFVKKLHDIGYFHYTLKPLGHVGIFFVWKSNRTKLRMITDARGPNAILKCLLG